MNTEKVARAIEQDAGHEIPGIRDALGEMQAGARGRVTTAEQCAIIAARNRLGLSQADFSQTIKTSLRTLQGWEQGRAKPPGVAIRLCELIVANPSVMHDAA